MPRLSIVIPCQGGAGEFDATLVSVLQNRPPDCEVLVVHTEPYDDPYRLDGEVDFLHFDCPNLTGLINAGLASARGEIIHILGCGLEATEGWTAAAVAHFDDGDVAAVSPLVLAPDRRTVVAAGVQFTRGGRRRLVTDRRILNSGSARLRARVLGPTLTAAFYRRDVLAALGGLDQSADDSHADVETAFCIQALGHLQVCEPAARLVQTAGHCAASPVIGFNAGRSAERLFWRHAASRGLPLSLAQHPLAVLVSLFASGARLGSVAGLLGRLVAWTEFGSSARYERKLAEARERLAEVAELRATIRLADKRSRPAARRRAA